MPKLKLQTFTPPQTLVFVPANGSTINPNTVSATDPGVGTVQFWRDTPRVGLEVAVTTVDNGIVTNTQEQGDGEYFILIEGVENMNQNPYQPLTQRFTIQGGSYHLEEVGEV